MRGFMFDYHNLKAALTKMLQFQCVNRDLTVEDIDLIVDLCLEITKRNEAAENVRQFKENFGEISVKQFIQDQP
jgi:hypothetical protein